MQRNVAALAWDDIRVFLALARARTMGEAARGLGVDISTVSRRLVALEETLDTVLFDRGRDGLRPTQAALELRPAAERAEEGVFEFAHAAQGLEREVAGEVRVACPPDAAEVVLLPVAADLRARHPELRVTLLPDEALVDLDRREADLALRTVRPTHGELVVRKVLRLTTSLATSPELAARLGPLAQLNAAPWIGWGERIDSPMARWLRDHVDAEPVLRADRLTTQIAAARAGMGVALVPTPSVAHYGLIALSFAPEAAAAAESLPQSDLFMVTHRALRRVPRVAALWDALLERFAG